MDLPLEQQAIREKCYLPQGEFIEFSMTDLETSVPECFDKVVQKFPERLAVDDGSVSLTYRELDLAANRIAARILEQPGEEPVALLFEHGALTIAAILGTLKAARIYVPLDPTLPAARQAAMLQDCQAKLILTNSKNLSQARELAQDGQVIVNCDDLQVDAAAENPDRKIAADQPALILYTSGSTGRPKGVLHSHRNLLVEARNYINDVRICPEDRLSLCQSCSFANSIRNIYGALLSGAAVYPYDLAVQGIPRLAEWLRAHRITIFHTLATIMRQLLDTVPPNATFPALRILRFGGEPTNGDDVKTFQRRFAPNCVLMNVIGSTETFTIRRYFVPDDAAAMDKVPLGYSVAGKDILLLDPEGQAVASGQTGEIAVRSKFLALGYWRQPELTRLRFIRDPNGGEQRLYLTGDLGVMLPDGCLIHMGRNDFQVKIRGNRVEVTEIEAALLRLDSVRAAVVHAHADVASEQRLVAYVVPHTSKIPTTGELRRALATSLPIYMVPSAFVFLEAIPVVPNGRVDRSALPVPPIMRPELETAFAPPRSPVEKQLAQIWSEVLSLDQVGIDDNFFALGGHSLLAAKMFAVLDEKFGRTYPLSLLLSSPTIRQLAEHYDCPVETLRKLTSLIPLRSRGSLPPVFAVPGVFGNVLGYVELARELGEDQPFYALQAVGLDGLQPPFATIEAIAEHYIGEIKSLHHQSPYVIIGACFGATVAYEMARRLLAAGNEVAYLALIDPHNLEDLDDLSVRDEGFKSWNRASTMLNLFSSRIHLYREELSKMAGHERISYFLRKAFTVSATLAHGNKTKPLTRELHQLEVARANRRALRHYRREPLTGSLRIFEVFMSNHHPNGSSERSAWQVLWNGEVKLHHVPAKDSGDMLTAKNVVELGRTIAERLGRSPRSPTPQRMAAPVNIVAK